MKGYYPQAGDEVDTYFRKVTIGRLRLQVRYYIALMPPVEPLTKGNPVRLDKATSLETGSVFPKLNKTLEGAMLGSEDLKANAS